MNRWREKGKQRRLYSKLRKQTEPPGQARVEYSVWSVQVDYCADDLHLHLYLRLFTYQLRIHPGYALNLGGLCAMQLRWCLCLNAARDSYILPSGRRCYVLFVTALIDQVVCWHLRGYRGTVSSQSHPSSLASSLASDLFRGDSRANPATDRNYGGGTPLPGPSPR